MCLQVTGSSLILTGELLRANLNSCIGLRALCQQHSVPLFYPNLLKPSCGQSPSAFYGKLKCFGCAGGVCVYCNPVLGQGSAIEMPTTLLQEVCKSKVYQGMLMSSRAVGKPSGGPDNIGGACGSLEWLLAMQIMTSCHGSFGSTSTSGQSCEAEHNRRTAAMHSNIARCTCRTLTCTTGTQVGACRRRDSSLCGHQGEVQYHQRLGR